MAVIADVSADRTKVMMKAQIATVMLSPVHRYLIYLLSAMFPQEMMNTATSCKEPFRPPDGPFSNSSLEASGLPTTQLSPDAGPNSSLAAF
jgi:hypothetical protein